jgi:hypothetical protein
MTCVVRVEIYLNCSGGKLMSVYVLQRDNVSLECDMEYGAGKDVVCTVKGVVHECVEEAVKRSNYADYMRVVRGNATMLYISTSIFKIGRTPGELVKELFVLLRLC